ncbi:hypothetical protein ACP4OV_018370 [Aristida adscensionis]
MAGGSSAKPAARGRKRVEAAVLKRSRDGSAFTRCEACNKDVPIVLIDMHSCSLDAKIRETLEAQVVEQAVEVKKTERKRKLTKADQGAKDGKGAKRKRSPTAYFLFMDDFRKDFKAAHPDIKGGSIVAKEAGERWNSMTDEEKKPYVEKAAELKAQAENAEGSGENNVGEEKGKPKPKCQAEDEREQEVDQPSKKCDDDDEDENELDDDLDDDM